MFCPNCGNELVAGAKFCGNCGLRLSIPDVSAPEGVLETSESSGPSDLPGGLQMHLDSEEKVLGTEDGYEETVIQEEGFTECQGGGEDLLDSKEYVAENMPASEVGDTGEETFPETPDTTVSFEEEERMASDAEEPEKGRSGKTVILRNALIMGISVVFVIIVAAVFLLWKADGLDAEERDVIQTDGQSAEETKETIDEVVTDENEEPGWDELYMLGLQYLQEEDYEQAIEALTSSIEMDSSHSEVYEARAQAYLGGDTASADEEYLIAALSDYFAVLEMDDTRTDIHLMCAEILLSLDDEEDNLRMALDHYEQALVYDESLTELYSEIAEIYVRLEEYENALDAVSSAITADSENEELHTLRIGLYESMAVIYEDEDDTDRAVEILTEGVEVEPEAVILYLLRGSIYETLAAEDSSETGESGEENVAAVNEENENSDSIDGSEEEGESYLQLALTDYLEAVGLDAENPEGYIAAAEIYEYLSDYDSAILLLEAFPEENDDITALLDIIIEEQEEIIRQEEAAAAEAAAAEAAAAEAAAAEAAAAEAAAVEAAAAAETTGTTQSATTSLENLTGTFTGSAEGYSGTITVRYTLKDGEFYTIAFKISDISSEYEAELLKQLCQMVADANSIDIDGISGATVTTNAFKQAMISALSQ